MKSYQLPFDKDGNLMHYANAQIGSYYRAHEWQNVKPMLLKLRLDGLRSGRSAKFVVWLDDHDRQYPMFITDFVSMVKNGIVDKGHVFDTFEGCKRGQNYGIKLAS